MPKTRQYFQIDRPDVADLTTTINDYVLVPFPLDRETTRNYWDTWHLAGVKILKFTAADNNLKVKVMGSIDGTNFTETVEAEFTVTTTTPVTKRILPYWPYLQVQVKPAVAAQHGTLSILAIGTSITAEADTELTATIDPAGLATEATLGTMQADIALMKADLALVNYKTYKGKDRTTTTGAAEELTIPAGSKRVIISCAPSTQAYIEINGDATTSSPLYLEDPFGPLILDLGSVTKLSAYVVAGNLGAVFFG